MVLKDRASCAAAGSLNIDGGWVIKTRGVQMALRKRLQGLA